MALIMCDSFDHYSTVSQKWLVGSGSDYDALSIVTDVYRTGGRSLYGYGVGNYAHTTFPATSTLIIGAAIRFTTFSTGLNDGQPMMVLGTVDGTTMQCSLGVTEAGYPCVVRYNIPILATATEPCTTGVWYYFEFKVTIGNSGSFEVRKDGQTIISGTGDTQQSGNNTVNRAGIGNFNGTFAWYKRGFRGYADDVYICTADGAYNSDFLGDVKVECIIPTGIGSNTDWASSTGGDNYACVDEIPPSDSDYVYSGTVGSIDTYTYGSLSTAVGTVKAVQWIGRARKDDAGTRFIAPVYLPPGGSETLGSDIALPTSFTYSREVSEENPYTELPWTIDDVNGAEFGVKVTT